MKIKCADCGEVFEFTDADKARYEAQGLKQTPRRCPGCRERRRLERPGAKAGAVVCACCGADTRVPFVPAVGRPAFCRTCFTAVRQNPV